MVIQYQAGRVHRALCLEPVGSEGIPGTPSGRSSIVQTSPAKYNPFLRSALSLNTKFVNNFFYSHCVLPKSVSLLLLTILKKCLLTI